MFIVGSGTQGHSKEDPIVLEGYKSNDFDALLKLLVPRYERSGGTDHIVYQALPRVRPFEPSPPHLSKEEWISVLTLSTIWEISKVGALCSALRPQ